MAALAHHARHPRPLGRARGPLPGVLPEQRARPVHGRRLDQEERALRRRHPPHPAREQPPGGHPLARPGRERLRPHHLVAGGRRRPLAVHARRRAHLRAHRRPLDRRAPRPRALHRRRRPLPRRPPHPLRELGARLRRLQHGLRRPPLVDPQVQHRRLLGALASRVGHAPRDRALRSQDRRDGHRRPEPGRLRPPGRGARPRRLLRQGLGALRRLAAIRGPRGRRPARQGRRAQPPAHRRPRPARAHRRRVGRPRPGRLRRQGRPRPAGLRRRGAQGRAARGPLGRVPRRDPHPPPREPRRARQPQRPPPRRVPPPRHRPPRPHPPRRGPRRHRVRRSPWQARRRRPRRRRSPTPTGSASSTASSRATPSATWPASSA